MGNRGQIFKSMEIFDSLDAKTGWGTVDVSGKNKIKIFIDNRKDFTIYIFIDLFIYSKRE